MPARPYFRAQRAGDDLYLYLDPEAGAYCHLNCIFCGRASTPRKQRSVALDELLAEYEGHLESHREARTIYLLSDDVLRFPALEKLLDIARRRSRSLYLEAPGDALADPAILAVLTGHDLRLNVTFLSAKPQTYEALTGDPDALARSTTGIDRALAAGLRVKINIVITARNVDELPATVLAIAKRWQAQELSLRIFYPDRPPQSGPQAYYDLFPDYARVVTALEALGSHGGSELPRLKLVNLPLCQLPASPPGVPLDLAVSHYEHRAAANADCQGCPLIDHCGHLHPEYLRRHRARPIDVEATRQLAQSLGLLANGRLAQGELTIAEAHTLDHLLARTLHHWHRRIGRPARLQQRRGSTVTLWLERRRFDLELFPIRTRQQKSYFRSANWSVSLAPTDNGPPLTARQERALDAFLRLLAKLDAGAEGRPAGAVSTRPTRGAN